MALKAVAFAGARECHIVPQTMLQVKLNAHSGSSSAIGIRNRVPRYSWIDCLAHIV